MQFIKKGTTNALVRLVIISLIILAIPAGNLFSAEIPSDFSVTGTWKATCQSKNITIELKENHKGILSIDGIEPVKIFKWQVKTASRGRVYLALYFLSRDKKRFARRTLRMYNEGRGFKLKALYQSPNHLKVYNALTIKNGKISHGDGRMNLKR